MNEAPLNYLQRYIVKQLEAHPGSSMFNLARLFRLRKGIDLDRLADALAQAGRAHQALLSVLHRFPDGEILQMQGLEDDDIEVEVVSVHEANFLARRASYVKIFKTFDEGLVDAIIFKCGEHAYLLSNIHHLVCDGYSFPLILNDAHKVWNGESLTQDKYYEILDRREARSQLPVAAAARQMMKEILRSRKFATLPRYDLSRDSGYGVKEFPLTVPEGFGAYLESMRASRHHFFLACAALALGRLSGRDDVEIDWVFHGRLTKDELATVGPFMVDLPFPLMEIGEKTPEQVMFATKHWTFFGIKNAHAIRDTDDDPLEGRRLTFIFQDEWGELMTPGPVDPDGPFGWMIEESIALRAPQIQAENPFNVEIIERRGMDTLVLEYDTGRYTEDTVCRYAQCYVDAMKWMMG